MWFFSSKYWRLFPASPLGQTLSLTFREIIYSLFKLVSNVRICDVIKTERKKFFQSPKNHFCGEGNSMKIIIAFRQRMAGRIVGFLG